MTHVFSDPIISVKWLMHEGSWIFLFEFSWYLDPKEHWCFWLISCIKNKWFILKFHINFIPNIEYCVQMKSNIRIEKIIIEIISKKNS
jgi:hypothetical protein